MKFERELLKGIAPVVVLETLARGRMYGYELTEAISAKSQNVLTLGQGTLYPLLYNLEAQKLVTSEWETTDSGRKRKYYSITSKGKERLETDKVQLADLFKALKLVFGASLMEI